MRLSEILNESKELLDRLSMSRWGVRLTIPVNQPIGRTGPDNQEIRLAYLEIKIDPFAEDDDDEMPTDGQLEASLTVDAADDDLADIMAPAEQWAESQEALDQITKALESIGVPAIIATDIELESVEDTNYVGDAIAYFYAQDLPWYIRNTIANTTGSKIHNTLGNMAMEFFDIDRLDDAHKDRAITNLLFDIKKQGKVSRKVKMAINRMISLGADWPELRAMLRSAGK